MANLWLLFSVGKERYAIQAVSVVEVVPRVNLSKINQPPPNIAGQFNYQGQIVPVLDLSQLLGGTASQAVLSTRIILINLAPGDRSTKLLVGLMVEQVTDTIRREQTVPIEAGVSMAQTGYLGEKLLYKNDVIQCLCLEQLLEDTPYQQILETIEPTNVAAESVSR